MLFEIVKGFVEKKAAGEVAKKKRKGLHFNHNTEFFAEPIKAEIHFELPDKPDVKGSDEECE